MMGFQPLARARLGGWFKSFTPTDTDTALQRAAPWRDTEPRGLTTTMGFGLGVELGGRYRLPHNDAQPRDDSTAVAWRQLQPRNTSRGLPYRFTLPKGRAFSLPWRNLQPRNDSFAAVHRDTIPLETSRAVGWVNTTPHDKRFTSSWRDTEPFDRPWSLPYLHITTLRRSYNIPWQGTVAPPTIWRNPNIHQPPDPTPTPGPVYTPPPGDQVDLPFECRLRDIPGDQVDLPFRRFPCIRTDYVVDNSVTITRTSDDAEIEASSLRMSGDIEAFAFGFSAQVPREGGLDLVNPTDGPVEVEVNVNGQAFLCLVEQWQDDRSWSTGREDSITIQGRSVSAELDEPYTLPKSRAESQPLSALQLMQQELPEAGPWSIQPHPDWTDYPVPGGTFSYSGLTPIRAIAVIAAGSGAVVLPDPAQRVLHIVPRFGGARPWRMGVATATVEIDYGIVSSDRGQWLANRDSTPRLGIKVEGEKNGVGVSCRLDGTAGEWAEPVVEILCTDPQAGLQRGITELGQSWIAAEVGLQIPLKTEGQDATGWVGPGNIATVTEDVETTWKGLTTSWQISADTDTEGALEVWQQVGLERYMEWNGA